MKVVLFCGGLGLRMRDASERLPKPMVPIGDRPLLLHVMKYYAHFGHTDFILCLGYKGEVIKEYFLNYKEALLNDFVFSEGGKRLQVLRSDIQDWTITFVDTGLDSNIGQRLQIVEPYLCGEDVFLANYADVLTDLHLPMMLDEFRSQKMIASFLCVKPTHSFHVVSMNEDDVVEDIQPLAAANIWINGGYFIFRKEIFRYLGGNQELVEAPFKRLIAEEQLLAHRYSGFWATMDTFKDQQRLEALYGSGQPPWAIWQNQPLVAVTANSAA
jgi:glucose-1-phosphate cytidylyltransferase